VNHRCKQAGVTAEWIGSYIGCPPMRGLCRSAIVLWLGCVSGIAFLIVFSACKNKAPIRIGFLAGTSGRVADLGISGRDAAQMLVDRYNRQGGLDGRLVQLIIKDEARSRACQASGQGADRHRCNSLDRPHDQRYGHRRHPPAQRDPVGGGQSDSHHPEALRLG
jgi:hypothetical protein